jgi:hypothetical protein
MNIVLQFLSSASSVVFKIVTVASTELTFHQLTWKEKRRGSILGID